MLKSKLVQIVCIVSVALVLSLAMSLLTMFCLDRYFNVDVPFFSSLNGSGEETGKEEESALEYDGYDGTVNMPEDELFGEKYFTISSTDESGFVYLKHYNYGTYNGKGWDRANEYKEFIDSKYSAAYLSGAVMMENYQISDTLSVYSYVDLYAMPSYLVPTDEEGRVQSSDVYANGKANDEYKVLYYSDVDWRKLEPVEDGEIAEFELKYRDYVKTEYTKISPKHKDKMDAIISENGLDMGNVEDTLLSVVKYLRTVAELDIVPNPDLDNESDIAVAFLTQYKKGNVKHFATAATLLLRSMNIPARFTEGFFTICPLHATVDVTELNKYYWVEVYVDGIGWICIDVMRYDPENEADNSQIGIPDQLDLERVIFKAFATSTELIYLKSESFGDYNGKSWGDAVEYDRFINGEYSAVYMPGMLLEDSSIAKLNSLTVIPVDNIAKNQFLVPYYTSVPDNEFYIQKSDAVVCGDARKPYAQSYYSVPMYTEYSGTLAKDPDFEQEYREFVYQNYLEIDDETAAYMAKLIVENALDSFGDNNKMSQISFVADFIANSASYSYEYDKNLDNEPNVAIAFLETYKKGICQHYATAATLLYRALGIPARYTVGYVANVEAGVSVDVKAKNAHAWVEVYIDGLGWQYVDVTGGGNSLYSIELYPQDYISTEYPVGSGTYVYPQNTIVVGFDSFAKKGYSIVDVVAMGFNEVGEHESHVISYKILDPDKNDVTHLFDVDTSQAGKVSIYGKLSIKPEDIVHIYDGEMKYPENVLGFDIWKMDGYVLNDVSFSGEREAGHHKSRVETCRIYKNGKDITDFVFVDMNGEGKLDIQYGAIEISPKKTTATFTGMPIAPEDIDGFDDYKERGFRISCEFDEFTYIGSYLTNIKEGYVIYDSNDEDVTDLFIVTTKPNRLTIESSEILIIFDEDFESGDRVDYKYESGKDINLSYSIYGFEPYWAAGYSISVNTPVLNSVGLVEDACIEWYGIYRNGELIQEYTFTLNENGDVKESGLIYADYVSREELDDGGSGILFNVNADSRYADLFVYYTEFAFVGMESEKVYDGEPHYLQKEDIVLASQTIEDLEAFGISYTMYDMAGITNVGSVEARFSVRFYDSNGDDCTQYIKMADGNKFGQIKVMPRQVMLKPVDVIVKRAKVREHVFYDGEQHKLIFKSGVLENELVYGGDNLAGGDYIDADSLVINGEIIANMIGYAETTIASDTIVILNENGENVTANYRITLIPGKIGIES